MAIKKLRPADPEFGKRELHMSFAKKIFRKGLRYKVENGRVPDNSGRKRIKVFIADDSYAVVERLTAVLSEVDGLELVGRAADIPEATQSIRQLNPDVVILDLQMPSGSGINVLETIKKDRPAIKIIIFTNYPYPQYRKRCLEAGADFFLDKSTDIHRIPAIFQELVRSDMGREDRTNDE